MNADLQLTAIELDVCWEVLGLGETPLQLELPSPGGTWEQRRYLTGQVLATLARRGLAHAGALHPGLENDLRHLAQARWIADARVAIDGRCVRAIATAWSRQGVLLVRDDEHVRLRRTSDSAVLGELVAVAGQVRAGSGHSVNVGAEAFQTVTAGAPASEHVLADRLIDRGENPREMRALAWMCSGVTAVGQFGIVTGHRRAAQVIGFHDTPTGRYLQIRNNAWLTIAPADNNLLAARLRELLDRSLPAA
ncbi:ESX secretion-associated protein EspG [Allokutzneria oryzae]|uniref:ESX secretion-associated protein EspG n=1 Tax=Allokutzneria oryzae TaxID=1378989 RepID=A0ABV5ZPN0_9PSEU